MTASELAVDGGVYIIELNAASRRCGPGKPGTDHLARNRPEFRLALPSVRTQLLWSNTTCRKLMCMANQPAFDQFRIRFQVCPKKRIDIVVKGTDWTTEDHH